MARPVKQFFATCHPSERCHAKGLCRKCYALKYYHDRGKHGEKYKARVRAYVRTESNKARSRNYMQEHGFKVRLKHRYNITPEQYDALNTQQKGLCAICGNPPRGKMQRLSVDHDHTTGRVRGLLCITCNRALGYFENAEWHWSANVYLANHTEDGPSQP